MTRRLVIVCAVVLAASVPSASPAQTNGKGAPPAKPAVAKPQPVRTAARPASRLAAHGFFTYGTTRLSAGRTFEAVAGTNSRVGPGFGGEVVNLWRNVFAGVTIAPTSLEGQRVWAINGSVYALGIPVAISIRPIDMVAGWRTRTGRFEPFAGAGATVMSYKETTDLAGSGESDVQERKTGYVVLGGVDVPLFRWLRVGGEVRYRGVSGILGNAGVSQGFGEKTLGGVSAAARITVGK